jgi:Ala-tRNA(Pro) deacylase
MKDVLSYLENLNINYDIVHHPPVFTTEEADIYVEGMEGVLSKTMFMAGKKDRKFYLFIMDENKRLDLKKMGELVDDRLHFANSEFLLSKLGLVPGSVSLFGLLNNKDKDVNVFIDEDIMNEKLITFHPNENTATVFIKIDDMFLFLNSLGVDYNIVKF